ncbi:MAG: hypothetical protein K2K84_01275 [Muribaculaceae bacterium]|nr:hypothetical protein [Muribaculaceae bacterium]
MNKTLIVACLAAILLTAGGCKTSEKNYRTAYEKTVNSDNDYNVTDFDKTIYGRHRRAVREAMAEAPSGRQTPTQVITVSVSEDGGGIREWLKRYSVCVGAFKQLFNANSLRQRFTENGYPRTFIVQNAEPYYYILIDSSDNLDEMIDLSRKLSADAPVALKDGFPFILQVPRR